MSFGGGLLRPKGPKFKVEGQEQERDSWGGAASPRLHLLEGLGERCKLHKRGSGGALTANAFCTY